VGDEFSGALPLFWQGALLLTGMRIPEGPHSMELSPRRVGFNSVQRISLGGTIQ
jgi:hypothetical protein